jgi:predicted amidohydrolase
MDCYERIFRMRTQRDTVAAGVCSLNRRQALAAVGTAAGVLAWSHGEAAAPTENAKCVVRVAAVSYSPPFHDHRAQGVNLSAVRDMTAKVMKYRPDFVCYPEICASVANGLEKGIETAPELGPFVAQVGKIAREFHVALVVPFIERQREKVFNSVPIVDRHGKLVLNYHKNYPTIGEMEAGITPGRDCPVEVCDGIRVGAAVCFDANFDPVAMELQRQKAQLVFWPSMYWGGQLLQHWALRYGFAVVVAYEAESAVIDMNGRYLAKIGNDTFKVRQGYLPPWAIGDINVNRELFHLDNNQKQFPAIREKYGLDVEIDIWEPEGYFLLSSRRPDLRIEALITEFGLETLRDYLRRSVKLRDERLS